MSSSSSYAATSSEQLVRLATIETLRESPGLWLRAVYPELEFEPFHERWLKLMLTAQKCIVLAPRGHGKSTVLAAAVLWQLLYESESRTLLVANTGQRAYELFNLLAARLERGDLLALFGLDKNALKIKRDRGALTLPRKRTVREPTLAIGSYESGIAGGHYELIVVDDLVSFDSTWTESARRKQSQWFRTVLLPCLVPNGRVVLVGTRYHEADLYGELINEGSWSVELYRALDDSGRPLWPRVWSRARLDEERARLGSAVFALQYLNDPTQLGGQIIRSEWLRLTEPPANVRTYMGVDPAISDAPSASRFAIAVVGIDARGRAYVLDARAWRGLSLHRQVETIRAYAREHKPVRIGIESNAYQLALAQSVVGAGIRAHMVVPIKTARGKVERAHALAAELESGRLVFARALPELERELTSLPIGEHDDLFDALWLALETARGTHLALGALDIKPSNTTSYWRR